MVIRTSRRRFVTNAAGVAALLAASAVPALPVAAAIPQPAALTVNALMRQLVGQWDEDWQGGTDIPALHARILVAAVWADLCDLAGEPVPADVDAALDGPALAPVAPVVEKSAVLRHAEYLVTLIGAWEEKGRTGTPAERQHAASMLASVDRCLDMPTDCLDGSFLRHINAA